MLMPFRQKKGPVCQWNFMLRFLVQFIVPQIVPQIVLFISSYGSSTRPPSCRHRQAGRHRRRAVIATLPLPMPLPRY